MSYDEIIAKAYGFNKQNKLDSIPVLVFDIAEKLGFEIQISDFSEKENFDAETIVSEGMEKGIIAVDQKLSELESRFAIAREIAFYELFAETNNPEYYHAHEKGSSIKEEQDAEIYAGAILMPAHLMNASLLKLGTRGDGIFAFQEEFADLFQVPGEQANKRIAGLLEKNDRDIAASVIPTISVIKGGRN